LPDPPRLEFLEPTGHRDHQCIAAGGQPPRIPFYCSAASEGQWTGHLTVPKFAAKGTWSIAWVQVTDKGNNIKPYSQSDPVLANAKFVVH